jgi:hypothetical protein
MKTQNCFNLAAIALLPYLAAITLTTGVVDDAQASTFFLCKQNDHGRVRLVSTPEQCTAAEIAVEINNDVDLGDIQAQIDAQDARLQALEEVPAVVAAPLYLLVPHGETGTGCDLLERGSPGFSPRLFIAECSNSGPGVITTRNFHGAVIQMAPDSDYVYDGVFLCMTVGDAAIARNDGTFLDQVRVRVTPLNLEGDPAAGTLVHIRSTGSTPTVRTLFLTSIDEATLAEPDFTDPQLPCVSLPFADGTNFSNPQFEFDTWSPPGELSLDIIFPTLDGRDHTNPNDGDQVRVYQVGLTVAGRRGMTD